MSDGDRPEPALDADEPSMVEGWLDYHRATLLMKVEGLSDADLRRPGVPSGWSLLGLVKHLAYVERWWFRSVFAGEELDYPWTDEDPDADWRVEPNETTRQILELYRAECERSREVSRQAAMGEHARRSGSQDFTLRWILMHMVEETARHNGHADIVRELIDGVTGE